MERCLIEIYSSIVEKADIARLINAPLLIRGSILMELGRSTRNSETCWRSIRSCDDYDERRHKVGSPPNRRFFLTGTRASHVYACGNSITPMIHHPQGADQ